MTNYRKDPTKEEVSAMIDKRLTEAYKLFKISYAEERDYLRATVSKVYYDGVIHGMDSATVMHKTSIHARLIAAAPEMLDALKMALVGLEYRSVENAFSIEAVKAAIAKAEGIL